MTPENALNLLAQVAGKAVMPLEVYPQVQQALQVLSEVIKPAVEKPEEV